ncbi:hypothetical protein R5R35_006118 [Gryllus longicercus]|uniref:Uncharacterized protein n=1 Tax=Gryllus longicercus TaxID=2509291 RepID=A0AAN9VW67_9ORTH
MGKHPPRHTVCSKAFSYGLRVQTYAPKPFFLRARNPSHVCLRKAGVRLATLNKERAELHFETRRTQADPRWGAAASGAAVLPCACACERPSSHRHTHTGKRLYRFHTCGCKKRRGKKRENKNCRHWRAERGKSRAAATVLSAR